MAPYILASIAIPKIILILVYSALAIVFSYMCIEDYLNKEVDLRLCVLLLVLAGGTGPANFLVNLGLGYMFFHIWYYLLCRKIKISVYDDTEASQGEMGFLPSMGISMLIWCLCRQSFFVGFPRWDDSLLFCVAGIGCIVWAGLRWYWQHVSKEGNSIIQAGFGEGDIYVCTVGFAFFGPAEFLIILFLSLLIHLFLYKIQYFFRR